MRNYCVEYKTVLNKSNFLGKGMFTKAYLIENEKVILVSEDMAKECLAIFCQDQDNPHIPDCARLDDINGINAFEMPLYYPLRLSNKKAWFEYKQIKKALHNMPWQDCQKYICFDNYIQAFQGCDIPEKLKEALTSLVDEMRNYTDSIFVEISPRNAKVDKLGNLVLLDIIGDSYALDAIRKRKRKG